MSLKEAWTDGVKAALSHHGLSEGEDAGADVHKPSALRRAAPWLAGLAASAGAYKLLRTPQFSARPALRKIQETAARGGFHRLVDVSPDKSHGLLQPVADAHGRLSPLNKLKLFLHEGTTEAVPYVSKTHGPQIIGGRRKVDGIVHGRPVLKGLDTAVQGGENIEGPLATQEALHALSHGGKQREALLLQQHAPDAIPKTHADVSHLFEGLPADRAEAATALKDRVLSNYGNGVLLKTNQGLASGGKFPRAGGDWGAHVRAYDAHMADPAKLQAFQAAEENGGNELSRYMVHHGIYEGHVLDQALKDPRSVLVQHLIDKPMGEWRVHTVGGEAPTSMMLPRSSKNPVKALPTYLNRGDVHADHMKKFVEDTVAKLPAEYRDGNYAFDVMPHRKPDGSVGFKVLEMNPTEHATATETGGGSGFLDANVPFTGNLHYRAATGRHTPLMAGLGGLAAGGAVGGLTGVGSRLLARHDEDEEGKQSRPPDPSAS